MISEILYFVFVFPLESILGFGLERIFGIVKSYGLSIIILSLFVNIFLLKIFILTDKKAEFESSRKKRLDSRIKAWKSVYKKAKLFAFTQTLYRQNHYHPIFALSALGGLAVQIPFFYAMYFVVKNATLSGESFLWISDLSAPDLILGVHLLPILMTIISLVNVWIVAKEKGARIQGIIIALIFLVLLYKMPSALVLYWTSNMAFSLIRAIFAKFKFRNSPLDKHSADSLRESNNNSSLRGNSQIYRNISLYAIFCIAFLICVFNPYALYATDITQFDSTQMLPTLCALFGAFLICSFITIYLIGFIPKRFAKIPAFLFSLMLFIGLIYSFILVGDYGVMDRFYFDKNPFVYDSTEPLIRQSKEFIFIMALGAIVIATLLKRLIFVWKIVLLTLLVVSSVDAYHIITQRISAKNVANQFFSYSKSDKNIVVIMLDMFNGSHTPYILEQFPYFRAQLDGFMLFNNAISSANLTIPTIATLMGGEYYTAYNMNKRKVNLANSIDKAFIDTSNAFANSGFSVNLMTPVGSDTKSVQSQVHNSVSIIDYNTNQFVDFYAKSEGFFDDIIKMRDFATQFDITQLLIYGVFKFAPEFSLRSMIYDNGHWLLDSKDRGKSRAATSINYTSNFYAFTRTIDTKSAKPTFKFFYSLMTHSPFGIYFSNNKCDFFSDKSAWEDYPHKATLRYSGDLQEQSYYKHFDGESCAIKYLTDFIQALKNAGIYDNTQIFVISDHGGNDNINIPIVDSRADVLFLFKDFGAKGALKIDNRLMANYDIASIFCANLKNGCPNVGQNILKNYPTNREIIHTAVYHWILYKHRPNEWIISKAYKVRGNDIYNAKNWVDISDKVANIRSEI